MGHARYGLPVASSLPSQGLKGPLGRKPGDEGIEAVFGERRGAFSSVGILIQFVSPECRRLLENIGIKVG